MTNDPDRQAEHSMEQADEANGEGKVDGSDDETTNDTEERYGEDESPA